ncbi:MAG: type II toxin-antitoxin system RelE/ParE family toxin [Actinomycetota bacterium]|nr:type II toxin-antitoxin system RelE/ParE family toxin [Actinomycetota bacterium]
MTDRRLTFHPGVEEDLDAIVAYYGERDPALPGRFRARLREQVERIELFPESGAILFDSYRRVLLKPFPYVAVYLVGDNRLDLLAVVYVRRNPASIEETVSGRADG